MLSLLLLLISSLLDDDASVKKEDDDAALKRLEKLKVVGDRPSDPNKVYFGAWVTLEDEDGEEDDVISLLVHDGELYHLENEPFTGYFHDNC